MQKIFRKYLRNRNFLEKYNAENLQDFAQTQLDFEFFLDNGDQNVNADGNKHYEYDCENSLTVAMTPWCFYEYDYLGRRVEKQAGGTTTKYCYDGDQVIAEYEGSTLKRKFIYGPGIDEPVCMIDEATSNIYYYHYDGLGSVVALSNSSGNIVENYSYDVYGKPKTTSSLGNPYYFTGRRYDSETGMYYYRFRYYNPDLGRFMSADPIHYLGGWNLYTYCLNNPINWIDPWGMHIKRNALSEYVPHKHKTGLDMDPRNMSPSEAGLNTLPHPHADHIFEEAGKAVAEMYVSKIPYIGPLIEYRHLIIAGCSTLDQTFGTPDYYNNPKAGSSKDSELVIEPIDSPACAVPDPDDVTV